MSTELRYKDSITHNIWDEWKLTSARVVAGRVEISPGGNIQYTKAPKIDEEKAIPQRYKVVITYDDDLPTLYSTSNLMFELHMTPSNSNSNSNTDNSSNICKTITTSAHPNTTTGNVRNKCITYVDAKGGTADLFKVIIRNNLHKEIRIASVEVCPSYSVDDNTLAEIEQHIPSVLHYTNSDRIILNGETQLLQMDVATAMNTNLQVHLMVNGTITESCDVRLDLKLKKESLPYSPLEFTLPAGPFLLGLPVNIMQVEDGDNTFEVYMTLSKGQGEIKPFKVQCTIDGKGMLSKSSSSAPDIHEILLIPFVDILDVDADDVELDYSEQRQIPIPHITRLEIPVIKNIANYGEGVVDLLNIEQVKVADDIWFGPMWENGYNDCKHEVFIYNEDVLEKTGGKIQFKPSYVRNQKFTLTSKWNYGDLYTIELDNRNTANYERFVIADKVQVVSNSRVIINTDNFNAPEDYTIRDNNIGIKTHYDNEVRDNLVITNEEITSMDIVVDVSQYNDVIKLL